MDKKKQKVSAKRFLEDYRSGLSDSELMRLHGLNSSGLRKLLVILQERRLLSATEVRPESTLSLAARPSDLTTVLERDATRSDEPTGPKTFEDSGFHCRQCGAAVKVNMLTCPECGHVLSGEARWANLGPAERAVPRIPPWLLGCIVALPIALGILMVFKHILIPLSSASIQQRTKSQVHAVARKPRVHPGTGQGKPTARMPIHTETERLLSQGVLAAASEDSTSFTTADTWHSLAREEKIKHVAAMSAAFRASDLNVQFTFFDTSGGWVARVGPQVMELKDKDGFVDTIDPGELAESPVDSAQEQPKDPLKHIQRRLPSTNSP